ncbi:hypothetical protein [Chelativorans alearense]|uniref:hypothetical protein n=1 Tax=Chelativorans alearense TaxID=2681495 RepID=UPI0013D8915A|nr:hypothetical protein [Chelativorans alearense]
MNLVYWAAAISILTTALLGIATLFALDGETLIPAAVFVVGQVVASLLCLPHLLNVARHHDKSSP